MLQGKNVIIQEANLGNLIFVSKRANIYAQTCIRDTTESLNGDFLGTTQSDTTVHTDTSARICGDKLLEA